MANQVCVRVIKGDAASIGFRLQGGKDFGTPLVIQKVNGNSPAANAGLHAGDTVVKINNIDVSNLRHKDAQDVILRSGPSFDIVVQRGGLTWKPTVTPTGPLSKPKSTAPVNNLAPVTKTSLYAGPQENIGAIGTAHNLSAKPYTAQVNGGHQLVNKQYNTPLNIYSDQSIAETLSAQAEVLSNGVLGVNFKKNEKQYDSGKSAVYRFLQEAEKEPNHYNPEPEQDAGVITSTTPLGVAGLRRVKAPENKPHPPEPRLPPGQNICAECERLIVSKNHSGTISAALSSHSVPSTASLSPNSNFESVPQQYRQNSSVPKSVTSTPYLRGPISPGSNYSKPSPGSFADDNLLSKTICPVLSETKDKLPSLNSLHDPTPMSERDNTPEKIIIEKSGSSMQNYYKIEETSRHAEEFKCSSVLLQTSATENVTKEDVRECRGTISGTINTEILVDNIKQVLSPISNRYDTKVNDSLSREVHSELISNNSISSINTSAAHERQIENAVTQERESSISNKSYGEIKGNTSFRAKKSGPLASALAIAPSKPFNSDQHFTSIVISLPEETAPYLPPQTCTMSKTNELSKCDEKTSKTTSTTSVHTEKDSEKRPTKTTQIRKKQVRHDEDKFFEDLPKPSAQEMTMLEALTTVPDVPYSPIIYDATVTLKETTVDTENLKRNQNIFQSKEEAQLEVHDQQLFVNNAKVSNTKETAACPAGYPPMIQMVKSSYESKTDKVQVEMSCQFVGNQIAPITQNIVEHKPKLEVQESQIQLKNVNFNKNKTQTGEKRILQTESHSGKTIISTPNTNQNKIDKDEFNKLSSSCEINKMIDNSHKQMKSQCDVGRNILQNQSKSIQRKISETEKNDAMIIKVSKKDSSISESCLSEMQEKSSKLVHSQERISPSKINKPPPLIPSYQSNLVATQCKPPELLTFEPSPASSRCCSPVAGGRPYSPIPTSIGRAASPAAGPPPNPLLLQECPYKWNLNMAGSKKTVSNYIPQHQKNADGLQLTNSLEHSKNVHTEYSMVENSNMAKQQIFKNSETCGRVSTSSDYLDNRRTAKVALDRNVETSTCGAKHIEKMENVINRNERKGNMSMQSSSSFEKQTELANDSYSPKCFFKPINNAELEINQVVSNTATYPPVCNAVLIPKVNTTRPNVSHPETGIGVTGGSKVKPSGGIGRQAGAVGVAPNRGRGVMNRAVAPGTRVPLCAQCNANIRGPFITALGKIWCPEHFVCSTPSCRRALHDLGFVEERGQLHCEYCFEQYLAPGCAKCHSKVKGDCLKAIGKNYHPECFSCMYCGKLFGNSPFFLEDGQPYCENDWNELFTTKCYACGFPVEAGDRWVEALSNNYHSQCFNCTMCKKNLEGQSFFAKGGRPFCKNHAR